MCHRNHSTRISKDWEGGGQFGTGLFRTLLKPRAIDLQVQLVGDMMNSTAQIIGAHTVYCVPLGEFFHCLFTLGRI